MEAAKALMAEAGVERVPVELLVSTSPVTSRSASWSNRWWPKPGSTSRIKVRRIRHPAGSCKSAGNFMMGQLGWSGRVDPDGNIHQFVTCEGGINDSDICNADVDTALNAARGLSDPAARKVQYDAATAILQTELPLIYLYHTAWLYALDKGVTGFVPYPDGMIRLAGVTVAE